MTIRRSLPLLRPALTAAALALLTACGGGGSSAPTPAPPAPNVYVAGFTTDANGVDHACYWLDGKPQPLEGADHESRANSIMVSGGKVLVAGYQDYTGNKFYRAMLWQDGKATCLDPGSLQNSKAWKVLVSGTTIYVPFSEGTVGESPYLWRNDGPITVLPAEGTGRGIPFAMTTDGTTTLIAGSTDSGPTYWKNNTDFYLDSNGGVWDVAYDGKDAYFGGYFIEAAHAYPGPAIWKNSARTMLPYTTSGAVKAVVLSGSNLYAAGASDTNAVIWKNNAVLRQLGRGIVFGLAVDGDDTYAVGNDGKDQAVLWVNGQATVLDKSGTPFAVCLVKR